MELHGRWLKVDYLREEFQKVKNSFFPRWDRKQRWKVEFANSKDYRLPPTGGFLALCNAESKTILLFGRRLLNIFVFDSKRVIDRYSDIFSLCGIRDVSVEENGVEAVRCLLIHEICHARCYKGGHGMTFRWHLIEACARAREFGAKEIEFLRAEEIYARRCLAPQNRLEIWVRKRRYKEIEKRERENMKWTTTKAGMLEK